MKIYSIRPLISLVIGLCISSGNVFANGWEHGAVPFGSLVRALSYDDVETRFKAAQSLGYRNQPEGVDVLLDRLGIPEPSHRVRGGIYTALGSLKNNRALPVLFACLDNEAREEVRAECAVALGKIGGLDAQSRLIGVTGRDSSLLVRSSAINGLGHFKSQETLQTLIGLLEAKNPFLSRHAVVALGKAGEEQALSPLISAFERARLPAERLLIIKSIGQLAAPQAAEFLEQVVIQAPAGPLKLEAISALAATRTGSAVTALIDALQDPDPTVQVAAIVGLREQGDPQAAKPVARLAEQIITRLSEEEETALVGAYGQSVIDISLMVEALRTLTLLDPVAGTDAMLMASREHALSLNSAEAVALADGIYQMRRLALYGLGYTSNTLAEIRCGAALEDVDPRIRMVAVRCLGVLETDSFADRLIASLKDPAAPVRWTAAEVLGLLGDPEAGALLQMSLNDPDPFVRRNAAQSLGYLRYNEATADLKRLQLADPDVRVRAAAGLALESL